jgi:hypothetical protein
VTPLSNVNFSLANSLCTLKKSQRLNITVYDKITLKLVEDSTILQPQNEVLSYGEEQLTEHPQA